MQTESFPTSTQRHDHSNSGVFTSLEEALDSLRKCETTRYNKTNSQPKRGKNIRHCRQLESWDCGIACVMMIIRWLRSNDPHSTDLDGHSFEVASPVTESESLLRDCILSVINTRSIWTVDLFIFLYAIVNDDIDVSNNSSEEISIRRKLKIIREKFYTIFMTSSDNHLQPINHLKASLLFCSTTLSVNGAYKEYDYYRNAFGNDEERVQSQFIDAKKIGLPLFQVNRCTRANNLGMNTVLSIIDNNNCVAIALIDNNVLFPGKGRKCVAKNDVLNGKTQYSNNNECSYDSTKATGQTAVGGDHSYSGHYVILCGISRCPCDIALVEPLVSESRAVQQIDKEKSVNNIINTYGHYDKNQNSLFSFYEEPFCLVIKNPGVDTMTQFVTPQQFESAWIADGTDQDIIFIAKQS